MSTTSSHLQTNSGRNLQETLDRVARGVRDPDAARKACERMDAGREEMHKRLGTVDVVVPILRELRDE